jgi:hypothetical protein
VKTNVRNHYRRNETDPCRGTTNGVRRTQGDWTSRLDLRRDHGRYLDRSVRVSLTVLGTSAEGGDCGEVGRGNRVNGIAASNRPLGLEAAAGKNPVSHVGKIYTLHPAAGEDVKVMGYRLDRELTQSDPQLLEQSSHRQVRRPPKSMTECPSFSKSLTFRAGSSLRHLQLVR